MNIIESPKTQKVSNGVNSKTFIIGHHTGSGENTTFQSMLNYIGYNKNAYVSVHYLIDKDGKIYHQCDDDKIAWHVGMGIDPRDSKKKNMNPYCIGIEIFSDGVKFTNAQRVSFLDLCIYLCNKYGISSDNVLWHSEVSWYRGKWDIGESFGDKERFRKELKMKLLKNNMNEEQQKAINAVMAVNSYAWKDLPEKYKKMVEEFNKEVRKDIDTIK